MFSQEFASLPFSEVNFTEIADCLGIAGKIDSAGPQVCSIQPSVTVSLASNLVFFNFLLSPIDL